MKTKLSGANSLEEVKDILSGQSSLDPERVYQELEHRRSDRSEKLDLEELDAISGGEHRDWVKDGCAATCEEGSWCWSNDKCQVWDVTYENFWIRCPDGHPHEYNGGQICTRCGHLSPYCDFDEG